MRPSMRAGVGREGDRRLYEQLLSSKYEFPEDCEVSAEVDDLLSKLLDPNFETRIGVEEALAQPWIRLHRLGEEETGGVSPVELEVTEALDALMTTGKRDTNTIPITRLDESVVTSMEAAADACIVLDKLPVSAHVEQTKATLPSVGALPSLKLMKGLALCSSEDSNDWHDSYVISPANSSATCSDSGAMSPLARSPLAHAVPAEPSS